MYKYYKTRQPKKWSERRRRKRKTRTDVTLILPRTRHELQTRPNADPRSIPVSNWILNGGWLWSPIWFVQLVHETVSIEYLFRWLIHSVIE